MFMPDAARLFTPAEAGAVSGLKLKAVHNAIDKRIIAPAAKGRVVVAEGARRVGPRFLTRDDLVRLRVWRGVGDSLSAERRHRLFVAIAAEPTAKTVKADELLIIDVGEARRQVELGVRDLEAAEAMVVRDKGTLGGEPVFKSTRIPVYGIVAMLDAGASVEELLAGYPKLTARLIDLAKVWVTAHPRRGRPKSLKDLGLTVKGVRRLPMKGDPLPRGAKSNRSSAE
jgi:uncharacterized protein (DUF433 family)